MEFPGFSAEFADESLRQRVRFACYFKKQPLATWPSDRDKLSASASLQNFLMRRKPIRADRFLPQKHGLDGGRFPGLRFLEGQPSKASAGDEGRTRDVLLGKEVLYH